MKVCYGWRDFIMRNKTWELASLPQGQNPISMKWVYKIKKNKQDQKYKARLVAKCYKQYSDINYNELFALVTQMEIIILILFIVVQNNWSIYQMNIKSVVLNDFLEEVYIKQLLSYIKKRH